MRRSDKAMARTLDDELIILDVSSGRYFGLNDVGALIWSLLDGTNDRDAIVSAITTEFDVDRSTASEDLDVLLDELAEAGLVVDDR